MMNYVYLLISESDGNFYTGSTIDLRRRLKEHNEGKVISTEKRRPMKLLYYEACINDSDAIKREKYLKSGFGRRFIKNRIEKFLIEFS